MRENVVREFIEMSAAYAKDTAHVRKQFETPAEQTQHLTTLAPKVTTEAAQPLSGVVGARSLVHLPLRSRPRLSERKVRG
jgi:hypothetical protein